MGYINIILVLNSDFLGSAGSILFKQVSTLGLPRSMNLCMIEIAIREWDMGMGSSVMENALFEQ